MRRFIRPLAVLSTLILASTLAVAQGVPESDSTARLERLETIYRKGVELLKKDRMREAFARFSEGLALAPDEPAFLISGGLAAMEIGREDTAVVLLRRLMALHPGRYPSFYPELIQAYQSLGNLDARDTMRALLFEARSRGTDTALGNASHYRRDRFTVGTWKVGAFEHYELGGERAVRYAFVVDDTTGRKKGMVISLGSYELANQVWHETTTPRPRDEDRLFHLDGYYDGGHATYGMYAPEPTYDETRALVVGILEERIKPTTSSAASGKNEEKPKQKPSQRKKK